MPGLRSFARRAVAALAIAGAAAAAAPGDDGVLVFGVHHEAVRFDLARRHAAAASLSPQSTEMLGYGGGVATDVEVARRTSAAPDTYMIRLLPATPAGFGAGPRLGPLSIPKGRVSGPVQPSPSAARFAMHTLESAGLGEPFVDHVTVFEKSGRVVRRLAGLRDPAWLGDDRLVAAGEDGLFVVPVAGGTPVRIGPRGLAQRGSPPRRPSVSPDGRAVAFAQADAVWRIGLDGSGLVRVTRPRPGQSWPAWSPDGSRLVVVRRHCPPVGGASPNPELVIVSSMQREQTR
jgi:hypothetical protein